MLLQSSPLVNTELITYTLMIIFSFVTVLFTLSILYVFASESSSFKPYPKKKTVNYNDMSIEERKKLFDDSPVEDVDTKICQHCGYENDSSNFTFCANCSKRF